MYNDSIIFGKNALEGIVGVEPSDGNLELFIQDKQGNIKSEFITNKYWILSNEQINSTWVRLKGDLHYKYGKQYNTLKEFFSARMKLKHQHDIYSLYDVREASLINKGLTYYKGLAPKDVSILSFDIETSGLRHNNDSKLFIIANTFRKNGKTIRKLFAYDDYSDEGEMIYHWCKWVREINPSILCGHNVLSYDIPYMKFIADKYQVQLDLGRDDSPLKFAPFESSKRIDGNREQKYFNVRCYGREIVDTYFGLMSWDIGKKLDSYGLKPAIKQLGLEKADRQYYDAATIKDNYKIPEEWTKIKAYANDDGDDALAIFDKIVPTTFYVAQSVPKSFQQIVLSASGSQINAMLLRAYIQQGHSVPKSTNLEGIKVEGGISFGVPGIYRNVLKVDLKSAYPSQILRFKIYDKLKDPNAYFHYITKYFTEERLRIKEQAKISQNEMLQARDDSAKVFINSMYGMLNTNGLNFNNATLAEKITSETRQVIKDAIKWSSSKEIDYWLSIGDIAKEPVIQETEVHGE